MANMRAQVVFQGFSNLPEDRFVNTWHFSNSLSAALHVPNIVTTLDAFYKEENVGGEALDEFLSPAVNRQYEYRIYDLADPEPRVPTIIPKSMNSAAATSGHPEELSIVLSFHGAPPVTARRRGRIYFGPLANMNTITTASGSQYSSVHVNIIGHLIEAANAMLTASNANTGGWAIRSSVPTQNFVPVTGGFVDNGIDIQRRRGPDASARTNWGS